MNQKNSYFENSISLTLCNASKHPFYKDHWGTSIVEMILRGSERKGGDLVEIFDDLPYVTRDQIQRDLHLFLQSDDRLLLMGQTSGTTQDPLWWYITEQEDLLTRRIFRSEAVAGIETDKTKIGIRVCPPIHGVPNPRFSVGDHVYLFDSNIHDDSSFDRFLHLLLKSHSIKNFDSRASMLAGPAPLLAAATQTLIDCGISKEELSIKNLHLYGAYTNAYHKRLLIDYWQVPMLDNYSLSEVPKAQGSMCPRCGCLIFSPNLHIDVVGLNNERRVRSGVGRIVLTTLWPSKLGQPLINYIPGDVVEFISSETACCRGHENGVRLVGRLNTSICRTSESGELQIVLTSHQIRDVLFSPFVSKSDQLPLLSKLKTKGILGRPRAEVPQLIEQHGCLDIKYHPSDVCNPGGDELRELFLSASHELSVAVKRGELQFTVTPTLDLKNSIGK